MHMADALISPAVGGTMMAVTAGVAAYSVNKIKQDMDEKKIPLMGVMGAFVFAAQMINFSIPGTGSSGHLGGGMLLAVLLGPYAGFLTMASILLIQALFFGDGGLLAYGCNVFNLGFFTCFISYPCVYKWITRKGINSKRIFLGSLISSIIGLQMGSFSVVIETLLSGKTELPFGSFVLLMQPIHLAIGVVEGLVTAAVVIFVWRTRPELFEGADEGKVQDGISVKKLLAVFSVAAIIVGGVLSWFASSAPDGLEWSVEKTAGTAELEVQGEIYETLSQIQQKTAFLPDYDFKARYSESREASDNEDAGKAWPNANLGTSVSGIVGGVLTLAFTVFIGFAINILKRMKKNATA
ncbi:MAG TPA: cobalamin biosynthesis protein CbiM [Hungateiclostridium thermocellum]|jgi:cobalt/nickel transport system permease protein|uniref:Cobalamin (Vitamin B12) biosynthesis CbiM protein n=2 Tax=Acetivibrio thermocellus TaxID=1515 RepID=A3DGE5_ACET2|nr:energy-coupling factor ABC transporter permease [Acetivibrio thermocellus]CDG36325.1 cobalamin (vitamin B12) biosynthesis CbiM protein [Acetivibrio thermocellus BC1]ABN53024.1 cobalamin (vitamin B12) biosynthesis CbiM protein [Acetivibrio thermocellus ATCC 27405]ADU75489.1 cobalamin (vitamin B12) biosynthesis CbiM protein [Acetivibrio thermocellus DSM 1313]ALX09490.1 cobalamin (vitamin B12) biosynthesis CbiM protein [Acetivibrio thermocellus AD2]ANV77244.1 cobalamin (vitamin B12) biosynthes